MGKPEDRERADVAAEISERLRARHRRRTFGRPTTTFSFPTRAGNSAGFGWRRTG